MDLFFQEITIVVSLILSSCLLTLISPDFWCFPAATDGGQAVVPGSFWMF